MKRLIVGWLSVQIPYLWKLLFLRFDVQNLSTNQIAQFFKLLYLLNSFTIFYIFLHIDRILIRCLMLSIFYKNFLEKGQKRATINSAKKIFKFWPPTAKISSPKINWLLRYIFWTVLKVARYLRGERCKNTHTSKRNHFLKKVGHTFIGN